MERGFVYDGIIISHEERIIELYHDDRQYMLKIINPKSKKRNPKLLYYVRISHALEKVADLIVKDRLAQQEGPALERFHEAFQLAWDEMLDVIERITGDRKMAELTASVKSNGKGRRLINE